MFKKILLPIDGTELSFMAVAGAASFAKPLGAEVVIVQIVEPSSYGGIQKYQSEIIPDYEKRVRESAKEILHKAKVYFDRMGIKATEYLHESYSPAEAIVFLSGELNCDLIFMASHGRKGISAVLLGSETQKVLTASSLPVMVYR